jgi:nucleoside 2-deoxyribosyltransferase
MRLYIAGPLFSPYHRENIAEHVVTLRSLGHECFVPQEQEHNARQSKSIPSAVFRADLEGLQWAQAMIVHLDDPDVSSGVACEMGIFYEMVQEDPQKKGILGILCDERASRRADSSVGESLNFFTMGCIEKVGRIYTSFDDLLDHLNRWDQELKEAGYVR